MKGSPTPREYQVTLENWRKYPYNIWAFVNVRSIIPTSPIMFDPKQRIDVIKKLEDLNEIEISHNNTEKKLKDILVDCNTDSFLVMYKGKLVFEFFNNFTTYETPHIIFSISKSLTSLLAGILVEKNLINVNTIVSKILPETIGTAYDDATIRNVLDMNVASNFIEDYSGKAKIFQQYRSSTGWDLPSNNDVTHLSGLHEFLSNLPKSMHLHGKKYHYK